MHARWAKLVPELIVSNLSASLRFWVDVCGFSVRYRREEEGFAYLDRDGAQLMLEAYRVDGNWMTGNLEQPFGRGVNFQTTVVAIAPLLAALAEADWPLYEPVQEKWYRADDAEIGLRQFLVQDPDGYLVRFVERLGVRPRISAAT